MQMEGGVRQGTAKTAIRIVQAEGVRGLYSGVGPRSLAFRLHLARRRTDRAAVIGRPDQTA